MMGIVRVAGMSASADIPEASFRHASIRDGRSPHRGYQTTMPICASRGNECPKCPRCIFVPLNIRERM
jgi:hypothetical protein